MPQLLAKCYPFHVSTFSSHVPISHPPRVVTFSATQQYTLLPRSKLADDSNDNERSEGSGKQQPMLGQKKKNDAELIEEARAMTASGGQMGPQQYAALRRKIGGTYKDFFKDSIEVDGEYVDDGWVDKTCRFCKKDTSDAERCVDKLGRYAHVTCMQQHTVRSPNLFARLFGL